MTPKLVLLTRRFAEGAVKIGLFVAFCSIGPRASHHLGRYFGGTPSAVPCQGSLMTDNKAYNMQNADLAQLVCLGAPCRHAVPDHRRWLRPAIGSIRLLLEAGGLDG